ncbi:MAG TPA: FAD-binding oxidoreductase [Hyphomicrobiales bacterium]|nr:FAD-binding oxidoreductase [Hyphomicrobiales bacterium]
MRAPVRRFSWFSLVREARRFGTGSEPARRPVAPADRYDVVILGGGAAALALAYHLRRLYDPPRVGLLSAGPLEGAPGAINAVLRTDRREPAAIALYAEARRRYEGLSRTLDFNLGLTPRGLLVLAHSELELDRLAYVAAVAAEAGAASWMVPPREARSLLPRLAPDLALPGPLAGALWQPGAALVDGEAVMWGFARMAAALGADIVEGCPATGLRLAGDRVAGVETTKGRVAAETVVVTDAAAVPLLAAAGVAVPLEPRVRHVFTMAPGPPVLDVTVESSLLGGLASRSRRGGMLLAVDAAPGRAAWSAASEAATRLTTLLPASSRLSLAAGASATTLATPDGAPILGPLGPEGLWACLGWDDGEVAAAPSIGTALAAAIGQGGLDAALQPFAAERFVTGALLDERPVREPA